MPSCGKGDANASVRKVIHQRPILRDAHRAMQREHEAAGANLHVLRDHGQCGAQHRGIGIESTKGLEVPLRRPYGSEPVGIGKARALKQ